MGKTKKTPKRVKIRRATLEEWQRLGLPETTTTIHFGKPLWVDKLKEVKKNNLNDNDKNPLKNK